LPLPTSIRFFVVSIIREMSSRLSAPVNFFSSMTHLLKVNELHPYRRHKLRTPQTSLQYKLYKAKKRFASSPASQPDERASFCRRAANSTVCHILYPLRLFFCKYKQVYIINKIFHRQSDGKKGLERRPTFSEPLRAHSAIRPKKAQLCIQPVIVRKITLADASSAAGRPLRQKPSVFPSGNSPEQNAAGNRRKRYRRIRRKATTRKSVRFRGRITKKRRYSDARRVTQPASGSR